MVKTRARNPLRVSLSPFPISYSPFPAQSMSPEQAHQTWANTRAKGKWRYVLSRGLLLAGSLMFLAMGVLIPWSEHSTSEFTPRGYAIDAIVFPLGGLAWGLLVWWMNERNFRNYESQHRTRQQ